MSWARRFAASLACAVLLASPARPQVRPPAARNPSAVMQVPTMPTLGGLTPDSANKLLAAYHRQIDTVQRVFSKSPTGTIVWQSPDPGSVLTAGQTIAVRVAIVSPIAIPYAPKVAANPSSADSTTRVTAPQKPTMPNLNGLTRDSADALLARYKQRIREVSLVASSSPRGTIVWQSPVTGSVLTAGQAIAVRVSRGDDVAAQVPNLVGRTGQEVVESLKQARLVAGRVDYIVDPAHVGRVVWHDPPAGRVVDRGTPVAIRYGKADTGVRVPPLRGLSPEAARDSLQRVGLSLGHRDSTAGASRTVTWQAPHENTLVPPGSRVEIRHGYQVQRPVEVAVPNLFGSTVAAASAALGQVGLQLGPISSAPTDGDSGTVMVQQPPSETRVDPGSSVSVTIGVPRTVIVPSLVGRTLEQAEAALSSAGLRVGTVAQTERDGRPGVILSQRPDPGIAVRPGSSVAVEVSAASRKIEVPNVVDSTPQAAVTALRGAGLDSSTVESVPRPGGTGKVVAQQPRGGDSVVPGTPVALRVTVPLVVVPPPPRPLPPVPKRVVATPNVVGLDSMQAQRVLTDSGFRLGVMGSEESDSLAGTVLSQSPLAGTRSARGIPVSLLLAKPRALVVPNVLGKKAPDAESTLAAAGLRVRSDTQLALGDHGVVTAQRPAGGTVARRGLVVELTVGTWPPAWLWIAGLTGSAGAMAIASGRVSRGSRDRRWRRRLKCVSVPAPGEPTLREPAEPLLRPDLQLQPTSTPASHTLEVGGPLFGEDSS